MLQLLLLLLFLSSLAMGENTIIYVAPTVRINTSFPQQTFVSWDANHHASSTSTLQKVVVEASEENNFLPSRTARAIALASSGNISMRMEHSTFDTSYFFRMRLLHHVEQNTTKWSPTNQQWVVSSECDDYLHVGHGSIGSDDPSNWICTVCPEGASCEYAKTDADVKSSFSYQRVVLDQLKLPLNESFQRCRVRMACLGMRSREFAPDAYRGRLYTIKNGTQTKELSEEVVDIARVTINPPRCNTEQGYVDGSILCEKCANG